MAVTSAPTFLSQQLGYPSTSAKETAEFGNVESKPNYGKLCSDDIFCLLATDSGGQSPFNFASFSHLLKEGEDNL